MRAFRTVLSMLGAALLAAAALRFGVAPGPGWAAWASAVVLTAGALCLNLLLSSRRASDLWLLTAGLLSLAVGLTGGFGGPLAPLCFLFLVWLAHPVTGGPAAEAGLVMGIAGAVANASADGWSMDRILSRGWESFAILLALPAFGLACEILLEKLERTSRGRRSKPSGAESSAAASGPAEFRRLVEECAGSSGVAGAIHSVTAWLHDRSGGLSVTTAMIGSTGDSLEVYESMGPLSEGRTGRTVPIGDSVAAWVVTSGRAVRRSGLLGGDRPVQTLGPGEPPGAACCAAAPVLASGRTVGVMLLESSEDEGIEPGLEGSLQAAVGLLGLTLEKLLLEEQKRSQIGRDGLTGLPSLTDLMEHLRHASRDVQRFGKSVAVVVTALDGLDRLNEEHGFRAGDAALRRSAARLRSLVGEGVMVARIGGNRFAACLPGADRAAAEAIAECITRSFSRQPLSLGDREETVTVSVGGCCTRAERRLQSLPLEACRALEAARASGGGSFRVVELTAIATQPGGPPR